MENRLDRRRDWLREIIGIVLLGVRTLRRFAWMGWLVALGCQAQASIQTAVPTPPPAASVAVIKPGVKLTPEMARRVELMIRNRAQVTPDYVFTISDPTQSECPRL